MLIIIKNIMGLTKNETFFWITNEDKYQQTNKIYGINNLFNIMGCENSVQASKPPVIRHQSPDDEEQWSQGISALQQQLEQQLNLKAIGKHNQQIQDRFMGSTPEGGFDGLFEAEEQNAGQQFMAVKPWLGAIVQPSEHPSFQPGPPNRKLKLQFVNGFKTQDSRQNMFWGKNKDQITYCAAALGISMNVNTLKQRFMGAGQKKTANGHTDDIMALGLSPDRKLVVTGSLGARPLIIVWDSDSMEILAKTNLDRNTRAVSSIRFSKNGKFFFCSDKHNDSNVYCFRASDAKLLGQDKCGADPVFDGQSGDDNTYGVATQRGMWFFQYNGSVFNKKKGIFGGNQRDSMITVTYSPQERCFFSGSSKGSVYRWQGNTCSKIMGLHKGAVMGLVWASKKLLSSGSADNLIKVSTGEGQTIATYQIPSYAKSLDLLNGQLLAATKCGKILVIDEQTSSQKQIMQGHYTGQTWGLSISPDGKVYTTADDNQVLCFNPKTYKVQSSATVNKKPGKKYKIGGASTLSVLPPNQHSRAVAANSKGHVIFASNDGEIHVRQASNMEKSLFFQKIAKQWIQVIKYSPDESKVAVGSHDNNIYILNVNGNTYSLQGVLKAHQSFIVALDWSRDGRYIQSVCGAHQYLFFDVGSKSQLQSGATQLKDEKWATYSVKFGWWVQGIFPKYTSGDHVNGVIRNHGEDIIATGDDWGLVNLYNNPCLSGSKPLSYIGHSSHVVRVQFDRQDKYIYSTGGYDKTLMMWKFQ